MITIESFRRDTQFRGSEVLLSHRTVKRSAALESLVVYELGYGGNVVFLSPTEITTQTSILHKLDRTIFTGNEVEMKPLVLFSALYERIKEGMLGKVADIAYDILQHENVLVKANFGQILMGIGYAKAAMVVLLTDDKQKMKFLLSQKLKDLVSAWELTIEDPALDPVELLQ